MNFIIRTSHDTDIDAIAAIYGHHVLHGTASFEITPPTVGDMRQRRADRLTRGLPYLVAQDNDTVVGYAHANPYHTRCAYRDAVEDSVYIRPDCLGRGLGKALLQALILACEARGLRQMIAIVGDSTNTASIRLHETLGFRRVGVLSSVGYKHGKWLDTVLLQLPLGPGDTASPNPAYDIHG